MAGIGLVVSSRLDAETSNRFLEFCDRRGLNRSDFVRQLIESAIDAEEYARTQPGGDTMALGFRVEVYPTEEDTS